MKIQHQGKIVEVDSPPTPNVAAAHIGKVDEYIRKTAPREVLESWQRVMRRYLYLAAASAGEQARR